MIINTSKKEEKRYQFKLNNLTINSLREITLNLNKREQVELALVCKDWYQAFIPLIWEYFCKRELFASGRKLMNILKKYGKYIKHLKDPYYVYTKKYKYILPNLTSYEANHYGLSKRPSNCPLPTNLRFEFRGTKETGSDDLQCYLKREDLNIEAIFKNLNYLHINMRHVPFSDILPLIPANLGYLSIGSFQQDILQQSDSLSKFTNLKHLKIDISFYCKKMNILQTNFYHLKSLGIEGFYVDDIIHLVSSNFPKLELLIVNEINMLKLEGEFNIRRLYATWSEVATFTISHKELPYLRTLDMLFYSYEHRILETISLKHIFHLTKLTSLKIRTYKPHNEYMLLDEIYPREVNQLLYLHLKNIIVGKAFLKYLFNSCKHLEILKLLDSSFEQDINDYIQLQTKQRTTNLTQLEIYPCPKKAFKLIKYIQSISPYLNNIKLNDLAHPDLIYAELSLEDKSCYIDFF